jgi:flagellar motor component MotA
MIDDDADMSNFLYQIQLTNAFCMKRAPGTNTDPSSMFDSSRVQNVFDYLVNVMHLYKNKKFVSILRKHPVLMNISRDQGLLDAADAESSEPFPKYDHNEKNDKKLIEDGLMWLISFHSFYAFHKCMVDIITNNDAQLISSDSLDALEKSFQEI